MKKLFFIAAVTSMMFAATGCSKDATEETNPSAPLGAEEIVQASSEIQADETATSSSDTRTTLSGTDVVWTAADQIRLIKKSDTQTNSVFTLEKGEGTTTGEFKGASVGKDKYALYPSSAYKSASGNTLTFELPAAQTYQAKSFASGANPMIGQSNAAGTIQFKNLCGVIKLQLTGTATINKIVLTVPAGKVSGTAAVDAAYTGDPAPAFSDTAAKTITLTVPNVPLTATATPFYFVVPFGVYPAGLTFAVSDTEGYTFTVTTKSTLNVARSRIAPLRSLPYTRQIAFPDAAFRNALAAAPYNLVLTADGTDININDADNKAKFASQAAISVNGAVNVRGQIKSLQGIEYFTGLTSLSCYWQQLQSLDLSKNTKLASLDCGSNYITSLTLPATNTITTLKIADNQLTTLDVSRFAALSLLSCSQNKLSVLNISSLYLLTAANTVVGAQLNNQTLRLIMTAAQKTAWAAAPVSANNANVNGGFFPDANFRTYLRNDSTMGFVPTSDGSDIDMQNSVNRIKFSTVTLINCGSKSIASLIGIEYFTALTSLVCPDNQLTSLDLSSLKKLTKLLCSMNRLSTLDISMLPITSFTAYDPGLGNHKNASDTAISITVYMTATQKALRDKVGSFNGTYNANVTPMVK